MKNTESNTFHARFFSFGYFYFFDQRPSAAEAKYPRRTGKTPLATRIIKRVDKYLIVGSFGLAKLSSNTINSKLMLIKLLTEEGDFFLKSDWYHIISLGFSTSLRKVSASDVKTFSLSPSTKNNLISEIFIFPHQDQMAWLQTWIL